MERDTRSQLSEQLSRLERRLPAGMARAMPWLRQPGLVCLRVPAGLLLILGGIAGIVLPVLGVWMIPLGVILLTLDVPFFHPPLIRLLAWINRKWAAQGL